MAIEIKIFLFLLFVAVIWIVSGLVVEQFFFSNSYGAGYDEKKKKMRAFFFLGPLATGLLVLMIIL